MALDKRFQSEAIVTHGVEGEIPEDLGRKDARPGRGALTRPMMEGVSGRREATDVQIVRKWGNVELYMMGE